MKIIFNDEEKELADRAMLRDLLNEIGLFELSGWAIAVNEEVVPSEKVDHCELSENDNIILIQATQGG